jgi:hypothetical protein
MSILRELFKNIPSDNFKLPMRDFVSLGSYESNGELYEIFKHQDSRIQLIVNVDTLKVIDIKIGRIR